MKQKVVISQRFANAASDEIEETKARLHKPPFMPTSGPKRRRMRLGAYIKLIVLYPSMLVGNF